VAVFTAYNAAAKRTGQSLEIATFRALSAARAEFFGRYKDLDKHDDSNTYSKEEPPQHIGNNALPGDENLDFIVRHPTAGHIGLECKNVRHWLYPDSNEVMDAVRKCVTLDCIPVLIARRIPFVTFMLLTKCGGIVHQTYNQLYPLADAEVAAKARDKNLLGYHDTHPVHRCVTAWYAVRQMIARSTWYRAASAPGTAQPSKPSGTGASAR
jgi:hypothetical protein